MKFLYVLADFEERIQLKESLINLLIACFDFRLNAEQSTLLDEILDRRAIYQSTSADWLVQYLTAQSGNRAAELTVPAEIVDAIAILLDIDQRICKLGLRYEDGEVDWPILMTGTRTKIHPVHGNAKVRRSDAGEPPSGYRITILRQDTFEIYLDCKPALPYGENAHLPKNVSSCLPYDLAILPAQYVADAPYVVMINQANDCFAISKQGRALLYPLSSVLGFHLSARQGSSTDPGDITLEVELSAGQMKPLHTRRVPILCSYRYSSDTLSWFRAQAENLSAVLRKPVIV